jgi:outer membrane protein TolC
MTQGATSNLGRLGCVVLALAFLLAAPSIAQPPADGYPMTLDDAIERALATNENIVIERAALASAEAAVRGARGAYDPLVEVDAGWQQTTTPVNSVFSGAPPGEFAPTTEGLEGGGSVRQLLPIGGEIEAHARAGRNTTDSAFALLSPAYDTVVGFELRQPLLRGRTVDPARRTLRVAAAERDRASALLRLEVSDTVAAVARAYWTLVAAREEIVVREDTVRLAEEQLSETGIRIDTGVAPETEAAQPRAELERRRGDLLLARETVARAENELKLLVLGDSETELWSEHIVPVDEAGVPTGTPDLADAMARALASRAELDAATALETRRREETRFARAEVRPALDAVVLYDRFGLAGSQNPNAAPPPGIAASAPQRLEGSLGRSFSVLEDGDFDDARIGLALSLPIGNRAALAAAEIAENAERQAAAELARSRKAVRVEVLDAAAALDTAAQRIDAAREAREAALVQLQAERDRYGAGLSTNFLVLTRQNDLERARLDEIAARTDHLMARTEMARATGSLLEDHGIEVLDEGRP